MEIKLRHLVTGILEATAQLLAMNAGFIPPTLNFSGPRPGCALDFVPNEARPKKYEAFISANYAFGGNNAAVVVTKWDSPLPARKEINERVVITGVGAVMQTAKVRPGETVAVIGCGGVGLAGGEGAHG